MPINFKYQGIAIQNFAVETYGSIILNENIIDNWELGNIMGINMDYESKNRGVLLYETTGTAPNRILKIEFKNVGLYNDTLAVDTMNFQTWLYETTNVIEYHVGPHNIQSSDIAQNVADLENNLEMLTVGLMTTNNDILSTNFPDNNFQTIALSNNQLKDTMNTGTDLENQTVSLDAVQLHRMPSTGDVFRFSFITNQEPPNSIKNSNALQATIAPNPSNNGIFTITTKPGEKQFEMYNVIGQRVMGGTSNAINFQVDLSKMSKGSYLLKLKQDGAEANKKLIIK